MVRRPATGKFIFDGVVYGLVTAGTFGERSMSCPSPFQGECVGSSTTM